MSCVMRAAALLGQSGWPARLWQASTGSTLPSAGAHVQICWPHQQLGGQQRPRGWWRARDRRLGQAECSSCAWSGMRGGRSAERSAPQTRPARLRLCACSGLRGVARQSCAAAARLACCLRAHLSGEHLHVVAGAWPSRLPVHATVSHSFAGVNVLQNCNSCLLLVHAAGRKHICQALTSLRVTARSVCFCH